MSEDSKQGADSPEQGAFNNEEPTVPLRDACNVKPGVLIDGLQFYYAGQVLLVGTTMDITFNIPQRDGLDHNVHLDFHTAAGDYMRVIDSKYRDYTWHTVRISGLKESASARFDGQWDYKGDWSNWTSQHLVVRAPAKFHPKAVVTVGGTVSGTARSGSVIKLVRPADKAVMSTTHTTPDHGPWTVTLSTGLLQGVHELLIREDVDGTLGRYTETWTFTVLNKIQITSPNISLPVESVQPVIKGRGAYKGATITVYIKGSTLPAVSFTAVSDGDWAATSTYTFARGARYTLVAQQSLNGIFADLGDPQEFYVIGPPVFTAPKPNPASPPIVEAKTMFEGTGATGFYQNRVDVYSEQMGSNAVTVGWPDPVTGEWRREGTLSPGPHSIFGTHTVNGITSITSEPFGIRVRTGKPTVTYTQANETITFSGTGHFDEKLRTEIEFTILESPADPMPVAPPNAQVQRNGTWSTTVTGWKFGTCKINAVQKIRDNASGWIDSLPLTFEVKNTLPDVSDVQFTNDYQPTFSGKGFNGATVNPRRPNSGDLEAPAVEVAGGRWSTKASTVWGPSFERQVHIKQYLDGHQSPNWFVLKVTIPPQAPGLNEPEDDGLSPRFSGTCWPGATVNIEYSDETGIVHKGIVSAGTWQFRRDKEFALDITHTVTVTQLAAQQTSQPTSTTFIVRRAMVTPVITQPPDGSQVGRAVTVEGAMGMVGATLQLRDKQFDRPLGDPKILSQDGNWSIDLSLEQFRLYTFDAQQTLDGRPSLHSDEHEFTVVLLPPEFLQPIPNGKLPRTALLKGTGMRGGVVEVCLQGLAEPLLSDVIVGGAGIWQAEVTLPVGSKTIWARQRFTDESGKLQESKDSEPLHFDVVPAAPFLETPIEGDAIGQQVVVCGFGVPGDTVTVTLVGATRSEPASAIVQENRTWSVMLAASPPDGGLYRLEAIASLDGFESFETLRSVILGTFVPALDEPAPGRWVSHPVQFSGKGRPGVGAVVSWYNPDVQWLAQLPVIDEHWRGEATRQLPLAGNWYRFRQTLTDAADDATVSDWADSARFEVEAARLRNDNS
ncbi:hypothetical protein GXB78_08000 [Pseudomonas moraviensis subsp. stanleyae]|uniref:hypothetical protein n=1 Tax=Pseudomonas moraviensis TaxID=321662 RepID=UPI002E373B06|nr:hypothetical protein [Pseudomonas moraviensis]MED7667135.1 hypothetical protein [Pseudomonas moraviensis subsp. stanleyae]